MRILACGLLAGLATLAPADGRLLHAADNNRAQLEFFEKKIRPVLVKHCYECHSAKSKIVRAKLLVDSREGLLRGGESGPAVVPGKPEKSLLISAMRYQDYEMPPDGKLSKRVVDDFVRWVKQGAVDPRRETGKPAAVARGEIDFKQARRFWSFRPVKHPPLPEFPGAGKLAPIDRFVRARLNEKQLTPAGTADRRTLIRRLTFDLVGLPPTPEEIDRFVADRSPDAYEKLVDRLLASRHFGERWGRHWLDVVRFAESSGGGRTQVYHDAWRYRDYVIDAYNSDKPFNRFATEQIAGDLLAWKTSKERRDNLTATGFLMLGPTNYELQDKELLRMEVIDEQIDTMGRAFLGMTLGCVRCHEHKFDPIPHEDYYALAGIFRSTHVLTPGNVSGYVRRSLPTSDEHARQLAAYEKKTRPLRIEIDRLKESIRVMKRLQTGGNRKSIDAKSLPGLVLDDSAATFSGKWSGSSGNPSFVGSQYRYAAGGSDRTATYTFRVKQAGRYDVRIAYNAHPNRSPNALVAVSGGDRRVETRINQKQRPPIAGLFLSVGTYTFQPGTPAVVEISTRGASGNVVADAVQLLPEALAKKPTAKPKAGSKKAKAASQVAARIAQASKRVRQLQAELKTLSKSAPPKAPQAMACEDQKDPGDYFVCIRGSAHKLGKQVPRGVLRVIAERPELEIAKGESGRRELAAWLTSPKNPLTPRVYVNRVWYHLFGVGLVRTPDNFGKMGELPSHPQLLDWLAATFIAPQTAAPADGRPGAGFGWSTKRLIRAIVLSNTYRRRVAYDAKAHAADPENRLLWRFNRRRLEGEAIRDALLAISGKLDRTAKGPTIPPKTRSEFRFKHDSLRRSVYVPVFRNTPEELLNAFDVADPNLVVGRRNVSTLPTQALFMMNSPFVMAQAESAAARLLKEEPSADDSDRLDFAYRRALGRLPTDRERDLALNYLKRHRDLPAKTAWGTLFQALFASIDFRYIE